MKRIAFSILIVIGLLFSSGSQAQTNVSVAEQFVKALSQEKYEEAARLFDPSLKQVNSTLLENGWKQIIAMFGGYKSWYLPEGLDQNANPIIAGIRFEKATQGFSCNFNDKHQLVGFLLAPPPAEKMSKAEAPVSRFREEELTVPVSGGTIKGSLMLPAEATAQTPVALIIAGSGATDRNGNNGSTLNTNAYKMLAETLAENGIASLRYDKRLIGQSMDFDKDESKLRFEDYVRDAIALIRYLKATRTYARVYVIGHSEGALIGLLAAGSEPVNAYVSLCGAGENIANILKQQMNNEQASAIIDQLRAGSLTNTVPQNLMVTFRPSVQPYLISWMKYDPVAELRKLKIPALIVGGTTDMQVPVAEAQMLKNARPDAELLIIKGMNHILKDAPEDKTANSVTYTQGNLPLNKELAAALPRFLQQK